MSRRISLHTIGTLHRNKEENLFMSFYHIREAGFNAVDFNFELFSEYHSLTKTDGSCFYDKRYNELRDIFEKYKSEAYFNALAIYQAHAPFLDYLNNVRDEEGYEHFVQVTERVIKLSQVLECFYIVVHPLCSAARDGKIAEWELNKDYFKRLIDIAKKTRRKICIENIFTREEGVIVPGFCSGVDECVSFVDEMNGYAGEEVFRICFDFGHASLLGYDVEEFIVKAGSRIKALHLHDNDGTQDLHGLPYAYLNHWGGKPINDWDGLIKGLKKIGYEGAINFEAGPSLCSVPDEVADAMRRYICGVGKYIDAELDK